eukprot:gene23233-43697_t
MPPGRPQGAQGRYCRPGNRSDTPMTILITGGTKGIGLAIAAYVARSDQQLVLAYRSDDMAAQAAKAQLATTGARVSTVQVNVGDVEDV